VTSSLTIHPNDCDVWQDTIDLETEKSKPIRRTLQHSARPILTLDCMSVPGDRHIVDVVDDWSAKGFVAPMIRPASGRMIQ
jgi:hypothetical protein